MSASQLLSGNVFSFGAHLKIENNEALGALDDKRPADALASRPADHDRSRWHRREAMSENTKSKARIHGTQVARSVCPYCAVGCGQLIYHKDGKLVSIEGDPESPISRGHLCPKGSASFELLTHPNRLKQCFTAGRVRQQWENLDLETAMDMVADRVWESREKTFDEKKDGHALMQTTAIAHLGGATLDNEENYLIKKLFTAVWAWFASATRPGYDIAPRCPVWAHRSGAAAQPRRSKIWRMQMPF